MKKMISVVLMGMLMMGTSGCLSSWSLDSSKQELALQQHQMALQKAIMSNNETAIRAVQLDNGGVGIGVDISNLQALTQHPIRQLGAAVGDAALIWGAYEGVKSFTDNSSHSSTSGRDQVNVTGDGNNVNVGNSKTDSSTRQQANNK